jgi:hypothetical protein
LLLVDGYQTRLSLIFIDYIINDKNHPWEVCLGMPHAALIWQVGDSSHHDSAFKIEWSREKGIRLFYPTVSKNNSDG